MSTDVLLNNNKISGIYILTTRIFINDPTGLYTCLHFDQAGFKKHLVKLLLSRTLDFFNAFCGTDIMVGAKYATLTLSSCPGASIE
jgi:hypothetical protein